jgi:hypothetical protein
MLAGARRLLGRRNRRLAGYRFPADVAQAAITAYPSATADEVESGLRQYYAARHPSGRGAGIMPSRIVETARRRLVADTESYEAFCRAVYGRALADDPEAGLSPAEYEQHYPLETAVAWERACRLEGIEVTDRGAPTLFDIDRENAVPGAATYVGYCGEWTGEPSEECRARAGVVCMTHTFPAVRTWAKVGTSDSDGVVI